MFLDIVQDKKISKLSKTNQKIKLNIMSTPVTKCQEICRKNKKLFQFNRQRIHLILELVKI